MPDNLNLTEILYRENPDLGKLDKFVKLTDAARILGYASFLSVKELVNKKILTAYSLPGTKRNRILLSEILELKAKGNQDNFDTPQIITKPRRPGRPRKYGKD